MSNEIIDFLYTVPPVTRVFLVGTIGTTFLTMLNVVSPVSVINIWPLTIYRLQIWRPVTAFFIPSGDPMSKLMEIYMFYNYSKDLELEKFRGFVSDYAYYVLLMGGIISGLNFLVGGVAYMNPLLVALTYTWSQHNPDRIVSFYFGITFKAKYLPGFLLAFKLLLEGQGSFLVSLTGAAASYLYQQLELNRGRGGPASKILQTPRWLKALLPGAWSASTGMTTDARNVHRSFGSAYFPRADVVGRAAGSSSSASPTPGGTSSSFRWGRGHRLGD
ncbi:Der1-like family-domain-containing protein [Lipomyces arxii]|uniref:Der1-like family-domain-containing protein n=1 Tax=Lipomyces arxii TaxID=56418 RepID=UPI0034CF7CB7